MLSLSRHVKRWTMLLSSAMPAKDPFSEAAKILEAAVAGGAFPGAAYGVLHPGGSVIGAVGRFMYEDSSPAVHPETVYDIASVTKVVATTAMAMRLFERGILKLDQPLHEVVPEFVRNGPPASRKPMVTMRMLLAHSSGLPAWAPLYLTCSTREGLLTACYAMELKEMPLRQAVYSDIGFILLGEAMERLAGESLDMFVSREILLNVGMPNTMFRPPTHLRNRIPPTEADMEFRKRLIQGEVQDENCFVLGGVGGHAGLFSNVPDLLRYAACILGREQELFWPETLQLFTTGEPEPSGTSRALGWDTPSPEHSSSGHFFSKRSAGHLGFSGASLWIDFERAIAVVLLTNRCWPTRENHAIRTVRPLFHDAVMRALLC